MRLIDIAQCSLEEPYSVALVDKTEVERDSGQHLSYAILSHRWQRQEVVYKDLSAPTWHRKAGAAKLIEAIRLVKKQSHTHLWIDTCCIDKDSSSELSEAINSMYQWYKEADICLAYLSDVESSKKLAHDDQEGSSEFYDSVWFTRGWTLQELLAPREVDFYNSSWQCLGSRSALRAEIHRITGIPEAVLRGSSLVADYSVATRMFWASRRQTERPEDTAYCLLGLFEVNMPLLYGEGRRAFIRLQEEILKASNDYTLFAWRRDESGVADETSEHGLLADQPADFSYSNGTLLYATPGALLPYAMTNIGLHLYLNVVNIPKPSKSRTPRIPAIYSEPSYDCRAILPCIFEGRDAGFLSIAIRAHPGTSKMFTRSNTHTLDVVFDTGDQKEMYFPQKSATGVRVALHHKIMINWLQPAASSDFEPVAALLHQNHRHKDRLRNGQDVHGMPQRLQNGVLGPILVPKADHGLEAVILFGSRDETVKFRYLFVLAIGTMSSGQLGYNITRCLPPENWIPWSTWQESPLKEKLDANSIGFRGLSEMKDVLNYWYGRQMGTLYQLVCLGTTQRLPPLDGIRSDADIEVTLSLSEGGSTDDTKRLNLQTKLDVRETAAIQSATIQSAKPELSSLLKFLHRSRDKN